MRFIRKHGRIIPIRDKNDKSQQQSALKVSKNAKIKPKNVFVGAAVGAVAGLASHSIATLSGLKNVRSKSRLAIGGALLGAALGTARILKPFKIKKVHASKEQKASELRTTGLLGAAGGALSTIGYVAGRTGAFRPKIASALGVAGAAVLLSNVSRAIGKSIRDNSPKHLATAVVSHVGGAYAGAFAGAGLHGFNRFLSTVKPIKNPVKKWAAAYSARQTVVKNVPDNLKNITPMRKLLGP